MATETSETREKKRERKIFSRFLRIIGPGLITGADIGAMTAAAELVVPINFVILTLAFTVTILLVEIFTSYKIYARILKWLAIALVSYIIVRVANNREIMGEFTSGWLSNIFVWLTFVGMLAAAVALVVVR